MQAAPHQSSVFMLESPPRAIQKDIKFLTYRLRGGRAARGRFELRCLSRESAARSLVPKSQSLFGTVYIEHIDILESSAFMSSDPANSSPVPLFKRSTNKKPRPRRERSPLSESHDADASRSTENVDQLGSSSFEQSPMTQVAKLKAKQKSRNKLQGRLSFGAEDSDVS